MINISVTRKILTGMYFTFCLLVPVWLVNATWQQAVVTYLVYWFLADFVHSMFLHRWAAHKLWNPPEWLQKMLTFVTVVSLIGTPVSWASWHRTHHAYSDTLKDPHSPKYKSVFYIVFLHQFHKFELKRAIELARNKFFVQLGRHQALIAVSFALIMFMLLPWQWFLTVWAVPVALLSVLANLSLNVICHTNGQATNQLWTWPWMFNEAWHKDHHDEPKLSYTKFDLSAAIVRWCGWDKENK
jgi:stearoyl-CoA desaturase (delta-9 desaturase)